MFIIFGVGSRKSTIKTGTFHCPRCNCDRSYTHKKVTRYFTLFFIPLIPLNDLGDFVECHACKDTYYPRVLQQKSKAQIEGAISEGIRHVIAAMLLADGVVDVREKFFGVMIGTKFGCSDYGLEQLEKDLESLDQSQLDAKMREFGQVLSPEGKEMILRSAVLLAGADDDIDDREIAMIERIAGRLGLRPSQYRPVIQTTKAEAEANRVGGADQAEPAQVEAAD